MRKKSPALAGIPIRVESLPVQDSIAFAVHQALVSDPLPTAEQLASLSLGREPVMVAYGGGRDSTAMIIELIARGEPIDVVLFANTGGENPKTYAFLRIFIPWIRAHGIPVFIVRNHTKRYLNWPQYDTLEENCITNATLPSLAFHKHGCSLKWKVEPQNKWAEQWSLAQEAWAGGCKVIKLIGYDASPQDLRRYADKEGHVDPRFRYRYPLRDEWKWTLEDCIARIEQEGLPVPPKSSCFYCPAMKPAEVDELPVPLLRRIVVMEACATPFFTDIKGLWGNGTKGTGGAIARPGSMTEYIRARGLLPSQEIDRLIALAPGVRLRRKSLTEPVPPQWRALLQEIASGRLHVDDTPDLFERVGPDGEIMDEESEGQLSLLEC